MHCELRKSSCDPSRMTRASPPCPVHEVAKTHQGIKITQVVELVNLSAPSEKCITNIYFCNRNGKPDSSVPLELFQLWKRGSRSCSRLQTTRIQSDTSPSYTHFETKIFPVSCYQGGGILAWTLSWHLFMKSLVHKISSSCQGKRRQRSF